MGISMQLRVLCARLNITKAELARRLGHSPQSLNGKMKRESFTVQELDNIANAIGVRFVHKFVLDNGEEI